MATRFLTLEEVDLTILKPMAEFIESLPVRQQREFVYDMQTSMGFPASRKERKHYIRTGKLKKEKKKGKWWR